MNFLAECQIERERETERQTDGERERGGERKRGREKDIERVLRLPLFCESTLLQHKGLSY